MPSLLSLPIVTSLLLLLANLPFNAATCSAFDSTGHANCTILNNRQYLLHRPDDYAKSCSHGLILSFHGRNGSMQQQEKLSQLSYTDVVLDGNGVYAAYPLGLLGEGNETSWQGAWYSVPGVDDVAFTLAIVEEVSRLARIDPTRVYATGKSNGGGFVNLLACSSSSAAVFAAFAPVSAALYPETHPITGCAPGRPIPLINSHGLVDQTVPFYGNNNTNVSRVEPSIPTWRRDWALRNGCSAFQANHSLTADNIRPNTTGYFWDCPGAPVEAVTVSNLGHSWPDTAGLDISGAPNATASFNFTSTFLIPFFQKHTLTKKW